MMHQTETDAPSVSLRPIPPVALAACALIAAMALPVAPAAAAPAPKVEICHIPPANPEDFHTIKVSENALSAHLAHGDLAGPCDELCAVLCDDGNACTKDDTGDCEDNGCPTTPETVDCNDSNACTADSCAPATGCEYIALTGTTCTVDSPSTCEQQSGVCDSLGACQPGRVPGCCLTTAECEAWDTNLCTNEECIDTECVTTSTVGCETDACNISVCIPETGQCTEDEPIVCPNPECHDNGCNPETGCYSNVIDGCCISHVECDDQNNCTTDTCLGVNGCVNVECAGGDACNFLVDCDPLTCAPQTVPATCEDEGDLCTAESCVDGLGCVSTPVCPDDGDPCTVDGCQDGVCSSAPLCPDDGDFCTVENCQDGFCDSTSVVCGPGEVCDPSTGGCTSLCFPAPQGLAAWWTFDTDGTDIQSSLNGTLLNGATVGATGLVGGALSLDGVNDFMEAPDSAALTAESELTLDAWVNPTTVSTNGAIVSKYNSSPSVNQISWILLTVGGGRLRFCVHDAASPSRYYCLDTNAPVITAGIWQHVAATFNTSTQEARIYVDGAQVVGTPVSGSQTISSIADTSVPVQVGVFTASGTLENFWNGSIDEVEVFNRALSAAEIAGIYGAGAQGKCRDNLPPPPCFSLIPEFGKGGSAATEIGECSARAQCPTNPVDICNLMDDAEFVDTVEACLSGVSFNACIAVDGYGLDNGCNNVCPLPQGEADLLVCGDGGCYRHNSATGQLAEVFTQPSNGCGDTSRPVLFNSDETFWMYNVRNPLSQPRSEICIYDEPGTLIHHFDLPEPCDPSGCTVTQFMQRPVFDIHSWTSTPQGQVYAVANGTCRNVGPTVCLGSQTYMWRISPPSASETLVENTDPNCGGRPSAIVADPFVSSEHAYAVTYVAIDDETQLIRMEMGTTTPGCTTVSTLNADSDPSPEIRKAVAVGTQRIRVHPDGSIYFLAHAENESSGWRDEGIWRVPPGGGAPVQVLAMCDLINAIPGGTCTTSSAGLNKPIIDFAIHPINGNLYVLEKADSPNKRRIQVYAPTGVSQGILRVFGEQRNTIEFFPAN